MSVDTLSLARELRAAELASPQAEAIAAAIGRAVTETSATKADLAELRAGGKTDNAEIRTEVERLRADLERMRSSLIMWFIGTQIAIGGIIIAVIKL